jgi:MFS family permease
VSLVGSWVTRVATSWLVWRLTHSAWLLGVVSFCGLIPTLVLGPGAGVLVDRWNRHRALVVTQALSLVQAAVLAWLAFTGGATVAHVLALQVAHGVINAVDTPARQAFVVEMVDDRADLPNAIALNSSLFNGSRLVGPAAGGALLAAAGEAWCFALDAVSYLAVIASLLAMRLPTPGAAATAAARGVAAVATPAVSAPVPGAPGVAADAPPAPLPGATAPAGRRGGFVAELREGMRYAAGSPPVRAALVLVAVLSLLGMPYTVLMPDIAARALGGGPNTLGWLMTAVGAGALAAAAYLAQRRTVVGLGRVMVVGTVGFGLSLALFAWAAEGARSLPLALAVLPFVGATLLLTTGSANTVLQTILPDALRGRVMALYTTAFLGTAPFGSLLAGAAAARVGAGWTVAACGAGVLLLALWFARRLPALRAVVLPIYAERGLLAIER